MTRRWISTCRRFRSVITNDFDSGPTKLRLVKSRRLVLSFPGQGSLHTALDPTLFETGAAKEILKRADAALSSNILSQLVNNPDPEKLKRTEYAQPLQLTISVAVLQSLFSKFNLNLNRDVLVVMGHSLGEFTALHAGGFIRCFEEAVRLVHHRGLLMQEACNNFYENSNGGAAFAMVALFPFNLENAEKACERALAQHFSLGERNVCSVANVNSPTQIVISGTRDVVESAARIAKKELGAKVARELRVSVPFHSEVLASAELPFKRMLQTDLSLSRNPENLLHDENHRPDESCNWPMIVSNVDAQARSPADIDNDILTELLSKHICSPVLWEEAVKRTIKLGKNHGEENLLFIELGGNVLTPLIKASAGKSTIQAYSLRSLDDVTNLQEELVFS